ncbi:MAG: hypothetical protein P4M13_01185 [Alphaproteobacteria bacterium]|nr:hypothetical protein [Alphaproteobacteria bacterium]
MKERPEAQPPFQQARSRRSIMKMFGLACIAPALSGCGKQASYRYKLTLAVDTPQGVRSAYNVVEVTLTRIVMPAEADYPSVKGEALYLDVNGKPLVATLYRKLIWPIFKDPMPHSANALHPWWANWRGANPTSIFDWGYLPRHDHEWMSDIAMIEKFARIRRPLDLATDQLPHLVTFADVNDPTTVAPVYPDDLEASFGPGVKWRTRTIEITDEPLTTGIETKLPWLKTMRDHYLDGATLSSIPAKTLANALRPADFIHKESF